MVRDIVMRGYYVVHTGRVGDAAVMEYRAYHDVKDNDHAFAVSGVWE